MAAVASKNAEFYLKRGRLYADKGKLERAAAEYAKAVELQPDDPTAYRFRAEAYRAAGDLCRALADINKAVDLDLYDAQAFMLRGLIYKDRGEMADYEEEFRVAVLLDGELVNHETHGAEFARILKADEEEEAEWDELASRPEAKALFEEWEAEAMEEYRAGKTKPLDPEDL